MEQTLDQQAQHLINQLIQWLEQNKDAETAIAVYHLANWIGNQLDGVKESAIHIAQQDMQQKGLKSLKTPIGTAGWTEPKTKQLNEKAWMEALAKDPHLMKLQREFDSIQAALHKAQEPFMELPEPRFFIR